MRSCLLDGITTSPCDAHSSVHVGFHGASGEGGRVGAANVPKDYRNVTLENSPVRASQPKAYELFDAYAGTFANQFDEDGRRIMSLYLTSVAVGTGKTTSASALLNTFLITHYVGAIQRGLTPQQRPAYYLDCTDFLTDYNAFNRPRVPDDIAEVASRRYYRAMEHAKHTDFVVMDDIGVRSNVSDAFRGDLHSVINHRTVERKPTIFTSNIPMEELPKVFGEERLYDRLRDQCMSVPFTGASKRGRR